MILLITYTFYTGVQHKQIIKKEILKIFDDSIDDIKKLFHEDSGGFSYFRNKSQTHYYGVPISGGENEPVFMELYFALGLMMILDANNQLKNIINS